ncbi:aldehyde dehydrogenase iron-sulfur subunit PaoA [Pseudomonas sp. CFBP 13719]|uniref:aldehyde dehydrogenase iron-sulfur subunit PaoA n=1 Tax=Pseudomonas sp. CFBP 13719 TaxID=2775303 RepID=UPI0017838026|nr:aldehyde dehydrogenase iron-sulfur subunit PaoA [Pseudomonas sp. CFBP 13719]MBD8682502.1 aldehyde dehydrogenase iron-sulfur subunit [Pseudomonas sp. CFBP 13719]
MNSENPTASRAGIEMSRRQVLIGTAGTAVTAVLAKVESAQATADIKSIAQTPPVTHVTFTLNGRRVALDVDNRTTLLDALRERLHLTGSKKGCDHGQCGACTVIVEGRRINACLTLAVMHEGDSITTIEGLGTSDNLHPLQSAFIKHDGYQCGYCTPGQICSAVAMLEEIKAGIPSHVSSDLIAGSTVSAVEIRERMSGNICRCGAYSNIVDAILESAGGEA